MRPPEQRIRTSHTGSLPRPSDLLDLLLARDRGDLVDRDYLDAAVTGAVRSVVHRQVEAEIDVVNDGEQGKISYAVYVKDPLTGFDGEATRPLPADFRDFSGYLERYTGVSSLTKVVTPACVGPVAYHGGEETQRDLNNLRAALEGIGSVPVNAFVTAASPGMISRFLPNRYYPNHEAYVAALADAMKVEYDKIHQAGLLLQVDCPDLASSRHIEFADQDLDAFRRNAALHVEALNHALAEVPAECARLHLCWGNYEGPHHRDVPLADIVDVVLGATPATLSFEAANPRHAHEWRVWEEVELAEEKRLMPGVIDTTTNYVEHPSLVAERLVRFARIVGPDRVVGATDCGLASFAGMAVVDPGIAWAKLGSLVEGARLASEEVAA